MSKFEAIPTIRIVLKGREPQEFSAEKVLVGRSEDADFHVSDKTVSRRHLEVRASQGVLWLKDLGSITGTYVDDERLAVNQAVRCSATQTVQLGDNVILHIALVLEGVQNTASGISIATEDSVTGGSPLTFKDDVDEGADTQISYGQSSLGLKSKTEAVKENLKEAPAEAPRETLKDIAKDLGKRSLGNLAPLNLPVQKTAPKEEVRSTEGEDKLRTENKRLRDTIDTMSTDLREALAKKEGASKEIARSQAMFQDLMGQVEKGQAEVEHIHQVREEELRKLEAWRNEQKMEIRAVELEVKSRRSEAEVEKAEIQLSIQGVLSRKETAEREFKLFDRGRVQIAEDIEQLRKRSEQLVDSNEKADERLERLHVEFKALSTNYEASAEKYTELLKLVEETEKKVRSLRTNATELNAEIERLDLERVSLLNLQDAERRRLLGEAQAMAAKEADSIRSSITAEGHETIERMKAEAEAEFETSREKIKKMKAEADAEFENEKEKIRQEVEAERKLFASQLRDQESEQQTEFRKRREALERDFEQRREKIEKDLGDKLEFSNKEWESRRELEERDIVERMEARVQAVSGRLERTISASLSQAMKRNGESGQLNRLLEEVRPLVTKAFRSQNEMDDEAFLAVDPVQRKRVQAWWVNSILGTLLTGSGMLMLLHYSADIKRYASGILPTSSVSDELVKEKARDIASKAKFNPPMDKEFKDSFTDNILYTSGYADLKTDETLARQWVIELNHLFLGEFHSDEKLIVKYASLEGTLVHRLGDARALINANYEQEGIARMRTAEQDAVKEMKELVGGEANYQKVRAFEKSFFQNHTGGKATVPPVSPMTLPPAPNAASKSLRSGPDKN